MKLKENKQIQKDIDDLADIVKGLKRIVTEGETDDIDFIKDWQDTCYFIRQKTHDITKAVNKHVSEGLNPEYYEAKKKKGKSSAKKTRDAAEPSKTSISRRTLDDGSGYAVAKTINVIEPTESVIEQVAPIAAKIHTTHNRIQGNIGAAISKKDKTVSTIKLGSSPLHNPIHENDKPFE